MKENFIFLYNTINKKFDFNTSEINEHTSNFFFGNNAIKFSFIHYFFLIY